MPNVYNTGTSDDAINAQRDMIAQMMLAQAMGVDVASLGGESNAAAFGGYPGMGGGSARPYYLLGGNGAPGTPSSGNVFGGDIAGPNPGVGLFSVGDIIGPGRGGFMGGPFNAFEGAPVTPAPMSPNDVVEQNSPPSTPLSITVTPTQYAPDPANPTGRSVAGPVAAPAPDPGYGLSVDTGYGTGFGAGFGTSSTDTTAGPGTGYGGAVTAGHGYGGDIAGGPGTGFGTGTGPGFSGESGMGTGLSGEGGPAGFGGGVGFGESGPGGSGESGAGSGGGGGGAGK